MVRLHCWHSLRPGPLPAGVVLHVLRTALLLIVQRQYRLVLWRLRRQQQLLQLRIRNIRIQLHGCLWGPRIAWRA